jgi:hypothetical protein
MPDLSSAPSPKRLALFIDGTWNQVSDNTNIWRFRALFAPEGSDGREQRAYYSTGLGTKFGERISGGTFGAGIDTAITSAYEWLMENYQPGDGVFIFGFSRGACTARSLSGFISKCGLLQNGAPLGVNQLFMRYRRSGQQTIRELIAARDRGTTDPRRSLDAEIRAADPDQVQRRVRYRRRARRAVPAAAPPARIGLSVPQHRPTPEQRIRLSCARHRRAPQGLRADETIDVSVFNCWRADNTYRPPKLQSWVASKQVDLGKIAGSVRADNPAVTVTD